MYSEKLKLFTVAHPCKTVTVDSAQYRYILGGHLSTILKTDNYIRTIREFLNR